MNKSITIFNPKLGRPLLIKEFVLEGSVIDDKYGMFLAYLKSGVLHIEFQSVMVAPYTITLVEPETPIKRGSLSMYGIKLVSWELLNNESGNVEEQPDEICLTAVGNDVDSLFYRKLADEWLLAIEHCMKTINANIDRGILDINLPNQE